MVNQYYANYIAEQGVATDPPVEEEEIPVEEAPAPEPPPSGNQYYAQYQSEQQAAPPPPPEEVAVEDPAPEQAAPAPEPAPQGSDGPNPYYAVYQSRQSGEPLDPQFDAYKTGHYDPNIPEPTTTGRDSQGNPLPASGDVGVLEEAGRQITGDNGFDAGDLNPVNLLRGGLSAVGTVYNAPRLGNVGLIGQQALDDLKDGYGEEEARKYIAARQLPGPATTGLGGGLVAAAGAAKEALQDGEGPVQAAKEIGSAGLRGSFGNQIASLAGETFDQWLYNPENTADINRVGAEGYKGLSGGDAVFQYYQDTTTGDGIGGMLRRGVRDIAYDPLTAPSVAVPAMQGGKAVKALSVAIDPIGEGLLPAAGKAARATGVTDRIGNSAVGRLFQPSESTKAEQELTGTAETLFGALEDADGNPLPTTPAATQAAPGPAGPAAPPPPAAPAAPATQAAPASPQAAPASAPALPSGQIAPPATQAAPSPGPAAPPAGQAVPGGQAIPQETLERAAPKPIIPIRRGDTGEIIGMRDLQTGVERPLSANFDDDVPLLLERMKQLPLGEYVPMREAWFPSVFRDGIASQHLDAYYPSRGLAYDNYIDLMASRVRLWGDDAYNDMWNMWVTRNVANRKWREALHGFNTYLNVEQHSGIRDPLRDLRLGSADLDEALRMGSQLPIEIELWDPARLAGRPLPEPRSVIPSRRRTPSIPQAANNAPPLPPELQPNPAAAAPGGGGAMPPQGPPRGPAAAGGAAPTPGPTPGPTPESGATPPGSPRLSPSMQQLFARAAGTAPPDWRTRLTGYINNAVDPEVTATLDRMVQGRTLGDRAWELREALLDAQQRLRAGSTIDNDPVLAALDKRLDGLLTPEQLTTLDRRGINRVAANRASLDQMGDAAFKAKYPAYFERLGKADDFSARGIVRGLTQELPAAFLYNPARIIPFSVQQFLGNTTTAGIAGQLGAVPKIWNIRNNMAIYRRTRQGLAASAETEFDRILRTAGLPISDTFRMGGPAGEQAATLSRQMRKSSIYQKLGQVVAPQPLRDFGGISDLAMRESLGLRELVRLASEVRGSVLPNAAERARRFGVRVSDDQIRAALQSVEDAARQRGGQPIYSAPALRQALEQSGAVGQDVPKWADRVARDYQAGLKSAYAGAKDETNRVGFSFQKTNADEALGKVIFYSYWNLRASNLYARSLLKNPALLGAYQRGIDALVQEAEDNNYPDYLRGWLRYMSDGGVNAYIDPRRSFSTLITFADDSFKNPDGDLNRMTGLGRVLDGLPGMVNPVLGSFLYAIGALGADATAPDPTGTGAMFRTGYDLYNRMAALAGQDPANPVWRGPVANFMNAMASEISGATSEWFSDLQQVERKNPSAQWEARVNWLTQQAIRDDHPDWSEDQVLAEAGRVLGDLENEYVQEAIDRASEMPFSGPGSSIPVIGGLVGGISANALPTLSRPTEQDRNLARRQIYQQDPPGIDPVTGKPLTKEQGDQLYLARDIAQSRGPEDIAFERAIDGFYQIGTTQQRDANGTYTDIRYRGTLPNGRVEVGGQTYTDADIAGWDDDRRKQLAEAYLREQGQWKGYQAYKDAQDAYKQAHPELREAFAFRDIAEQYPGGAEQWAAATRASNPNYDQYVRTQENLKPAARPLTPAERASLDDEGIAEREAARFKMLTDADGYRAAYGIPASLYDVPMRPGDTGYFVAGVPTGLTPSQALESQRSGEGSGQQPAGKTYSEEAKAGLEDDLATYSGMVEIMNAWDASVGNAVGFTQRQYNLRLITGSKDYEIPNPVYTEIKSEYGYVLPTKGKLKDYLTWAVDATANPDGSTSVDDYLDWDRGQYLRQELGKPPAGDGNAIDVTAGLRGQRDANGDIAFGTAPASTAKPAGQLLTVATGTEGLADKTNQWSALLEVPPGLPLKPVPGADAYWVGPDRNWRLVELPDGTQVWVDAATLRPAA